MLPIDASDWDHNNSQYSPAGPGAPIDQRYNPDGSAANMLIYHSWADVMSYAGAQDGGLVQRTMPAGPGLLPAGTYRLRVDSLSYDGSNPPGSATAHKGYAVRALDGSGSVCAAWCTSTPI